MNAPATRDPLPVELLASDHARRLQTATEATRPLAASELEEIIQDLRRIEAEKNREGEP
jgi:hypothetical protein